MQIAPASLTLSNIRAKNPVTDHWPKDQLPSKWPIGQHRQGSAPRDGGGDPREARPGVWLSSCWGLPLGPPLCHPSSFSRTAVAREDPRATVPVPQGLAWSAPPPDSAPLLAQTPPLTGDHAPLWSNPLVAPRTPNTFSAAESPLGIFLVYPHCAQVSWAFIICQQDEHTENCSEEH